MLVATLHFSLSEIVNLTKCWQKQNRPKYFLVDFGLSIVQDSDIANKSWLLIWCSAALYRQNEQQN